MLLPVKLLAWVWILVGTVLVIGSILQQVIWFDVREIDLMLRAFLVDAVLYSAWFIGAFVIVLVDRATRPN